MNQKREGIAFSEEREGTWGQSLLILSKGLKQIKDAKDAKRQ